MLVNRIWNGRNVLKSRGMNGPEDEMDAILEAHAFYGLADYCPRPTVVRCFSSTRAVLSVRVPALNVSLDREELD